MLANPTTYTLAHLQAGSHLTPPGGSDKNLWHKGCVDLFERYESVINNLALLLKIYLQASTALADSGASDVLLRESNAANIFRDKTVPNIHAILPHNKSLSIDRCRIPLAAAYIHSVASMHFLQHRSSAITI